MISDFAMRIAVWKNQAEVRREHMSKRRWIGSHSRKVLKSASNRKSAILVGALLSAFCSTVQVQPQGKSPPRVGWIWYGSAQAGPLTSIETSLIEGVQEFGYVDVNTSTFEHSFANVS